MNNVYIHECMNYYQLCVVAHKSNIQTIMMWRSMCPIIHKKLLVRSHCIEKYRLMCHKLWNTLIWLIILLIYDSSPFHVGHVVYILYVEIVTIFSEMCLWLDSIWIMTLFDMIRFVDDYFTGNVLSRYNTHVNASDIFTIEITYYFLFVWILPLFVSIFLSSTTLLSCCNIPACSYTLVSSLPFSFPLCFYGNLCQLVSLAFLTLFSLLFNFFTTFMK